MSRLRHPHPVSHLVSCSNGSSKQASSVQIKRLTTSLRPSVRPSARQHSLTDGKTNDANSVLLGNGSVQFLLDTLISQLIDANLIEEIQTALNSLQLSLLISNPSID